LFSRTTKLYDPGHEQLCGGDVLLLAPGVVAIGVGEHTSSAGMERLARGAIDAGFAHTVLAVPHRAQQCLDTMCTVAGPETLVMPPALAYSLTARAISPRGPGLRISHPRPFLEAAAQAMGVPRLTVIETGMSPDSGGRSQWDDASNLLVLEPGTVMSYERNVLTNARLRAAAGAAAGRLAGAGVTDPAWATVIGAPETGESWHFADTGGRQESVTITFSYPGNAAHAFSVLIDHSRGGKVKDIWVGDAAGLVSKTEQAADADPLVVFEPLSAEEALDRLRRAVRAGESPQDPDQRDAVAAHRALLAARLELVD